MNCGSCGASIDRPGDYCLVCHTANADTVVLDLARDRGAVTAIRNGSDLGTTTVTTTPEEGRMESVELRNFAGRLADQVRRKRPDTVYATGDREVVRAVRAECRHEFYRVPDQNPVRAVLDADRETPLKTIDVSPSEKIGGSHSTLIGGRDGKQAIGLVAGHPNVKKVVPGPIEAGGGGSTSGFRAKVTRADDGGNLRMIVRGGSSVQENRLITTAGNRHDGERVRTALNAALADERLQE